MFSWDSNPWVWALTFRVAEGPLPEGRRERPILFRGELVRAILEGRKTQTRRPLRPRYDYFVEDGQPFFESYVYGEPDCVPVPCPYGAPGDRLWCRETWYCDNTTAPNWNPGESIEATPERIAEWRDSLYYRADAVQTGRCCEVIPECACAEYKTASGRKRSPWKPGIHMPRWASRLSLEITSVRVERLHAITEDDARAEGVEPYICGHGFAAASELAAEPGMREPNMYRTGFEAKWREIHKSRRAA